MDNIALQFAHILCVLFGNILTPFFLIWTKIGSGGAIFILIGLILFLRKKTRWVGLTVLMSIFFAGLVGKVILAPMIGRLRPYQSSSNPDYYKFWKEAGEIVKDGFSMPSGHTIAVSAFFMSLYLTVKKRMRRVILCVGILSTLCMILSRLYFMHHYLSDCLVGLVIGVAFSFLAKKIVRFIFLFIKENAHIPLFNLILNFDILGNQ